ncbi:hypothetical protein PPERSA_07064 [Pseudocohnilembus persalinus]|uniref:RING-type domain-containing protein n=1 Tax=Pseudocohnilembus persalinus TaxID=266149 RepID=A0A0V0QAM4_PSEPJ|nr:hypothetical protein PPERSA_07064 [Pseudocohnilembus persalinus]|eukprot:KRW99292.1 hypothetical protein PPERSA_07064 [Pseudocohnilembus persalinus]
MGNSQQVTQKQSKYLENLAEVQQIPNNKKKQQQQQQQQQEIQQSMTAYTLNSMNMEIQKQQMHIENLKKPSSIENNNNNNNNNKISRKFSENQGSLEVSPRFGPVGLLDRPSQERKEIYQIRKKSSNQDSQDLEHEEEEQKKINNSNNNNNNNFRMETTNYIRQSDYYNNSKVSNYDTFSNNGQYHVNQFKIKNDFNQIQKKLTHNFVQHEEEFLKNNFYAKNQSQSQNISCQDLQQIKNQKLIQSQGSYGDFQEENLVISYGNDQINSLKQQNYKQANIMQKYNEKEYFYEKENYQRIQNQNINPSNFKKQHNLNQNQHQNQNLNLKNKNIGINDMYYSPSKQQYYLKKSPQIPPKDISFQQQHIEFDDNDENLDPNIRNEFSASQQNRQHRNSSSCIREDTISMTNAIPCEFCTQEIKLEKYQQHQKNCLQGHRKQEEKNEDNDDDEEKKDQINEINLNQSSQKSNQQMIKSRQKQQIIKSGAYNNQINQSNFSNNSENFQIECEVCKKLVAFNQYQVHQEQCDVMVICNSCEKAVPSRQLNQHLEQCNKNPWQLKNNNENENKMKMCDFCRIFIVYDHEDEFVAHLNGHQKMKKHCHFCKKNVRFKFQFQYKFHQNGKCQQNEIKGNKLAYQRILLMGQEEMEKYNGKNPQKMQEYWDMLDRYIYEEKHGLQEKIIEKIPHLIYAKKTIKKSLKQMQLNKVIDPKDIEGNSCTICMDYFEEKQMLSILPCKHIFHKQCLSEWLKRDGVCAVCRNNVTEMIKKNQKSA